MLWTDPFSQHRCIPMGSISPMFLLLCPKHLDSEGYFHLFKNQNGWFLVNSAGFVEHLVFVPSVRYWRSQGGHNFEKSETDRFEATKDTWRAEIRTQFCQLWSLCWLRFHLFVQGWLENSFRPKPMAPTTLWCRQRLEAPWRGKQSDICPRMEHSTCHYCLTFLMTWLNISWEWSRFLVLHLPNPCLLGTLSCSVF